MQKPASWSPPQFSQVIAGNAIIGTPHAISIDSGPLRGVIFYLSTKVTAGQDGMPSFTVEIIEDAGLKNVDEATEFHRVVSHIAITLMGTN